MQAFSLQSLQLINTINTAGQEWLLLAFPGRTVEDARRMFRMVAPAETGGEQARDAWHLRIALAGPVYTLVAVLALCLHGGPYAPNMDDFSFKFN